MESAPAPEPFFPPTYVKASLFDDEPEQLTLAAAAPRQPSPKKPKVVRRPVVPLKDVEDWLEFAESVLGRQDIPADSLAGHFTTLSGLSGYEDQLEPYMGMDASHRSSASAASTSSSVTHRGSGHVGRKLLFWQSSIRGSSWSRSLGLRSRSDERL